MWTCGRLFVGHIDSPAYGFVLYVICSHSLLRVDSQGERLAQTKAARYLIQIYVRHTRTAYRLKQIYIQI